MRYSSINIKKAIRLAITMGDPGGIGPEIALKAVCRSKWPDFVRFVLIGSRDIWIKNARQLHLPKTDEFINAAEVDNASISILDPAPPSTVIPARLGGAFGEAWAKAGIHPPRRTTCPASPERPVFDETSPKASFAEASVGMTRKDWRPGKTGPSEGLAALLWIRTAVAGCQEAKFHGVVTGPICKYSVQAAGFDFPGHTEYLAFLAGRREVAMMLIGEAPCEAKMAKKGGELRVALVTRHLPLAKVASALTREKIVEAVELAHAGLKWMGLAKKPIGVCALNPHAGDNGLLGEEEISIISPAIKALRQKGLKIEGPIPADVIFHQAMQNRFSAVVAMYHDQGLGPLKMKAFETGVNLTLGLPFVRTSPDHGTAFNIAGKGIASAASMVEAIRLAINLARRPNPWK